MNITAVRSIIFSPCGGTLKAARALALGIPVGGTEHDLTRPAQRLLPLSFGPEDLALLAFPVYGGHVPGGISEKIFQLLNGNQTPAVLLAVYGNREFEGAFLDLDRLAGARGFRPVAAAAAVAEHSMAPDIAAHRPDLEDRAALGKFGRQIYERLLAQPDLESFAFEAPGADPRRPPSEPMRPETDTRLCTECGQCPPVCPVAAIPEGSPMTTGPECIGCMACVKICPEEARALRDPRLPKLMDWLKEVAGERKNPQFFF